MYCSDLDLNSINIKNNCPACLSSFGSFNDCWVKSYCENNYKHIYDNAIYYSSTNKLMFALYQLIATTLQNQHLINYLNKISLLK